MKYKELDVISLSRDIHDLSKGDVGSIVSVYDEGAAYEVEFLDRDGNTRAIVTLDSKDIEPKIIKNITFHIHGFSGSNYASGTVSSINLVTTRQEFTINARSSREKVFVATL